MADGFAPTIEIIRPKDKFEVDGDKVHFIIPKKDIQYQDDDAWITFTRTELKRILELI